MKVKKKNNISTSLTNSSKQENLRCVEDGQESYSSRLSKVIEPKIVGKKHKGLIAGFLPFTHMCEEIDNIIVCLPLQRSEIKTRQILDKAIQVIKNEIHQPK